METVADEPTENVEGIEEEAEEENEEEMQDVSDEDEMKEDDEIEEVKEEGYFLKTSQYQNWVIQYIKDNATFVTPEKQQNEDRIAKVVVLPDSTADDCEIGG